MLEVNEDYAEHDGVRIHYVSAGKGPLLLFIHGFPDFWYSWRYQLEALAEEYRVVAMDQRGFNLSDKPRGQENYDVRHLMLDAEAVVRAAGEDRATIIGHDWGGYVAWNLAMFRPALVQRLVVLNLPHPKGFSRELAHNPEQQANSAYARTFQQPQAHHALTPMMLAGFVAGKDKEARKKYQEAFEASDMEAMLHYYKQNYPREPYTESKQEFPKVQCPVLQFHGLKDKALHRNALSGTGDWLENDLALVTVPDADHWVHIDRPDLVSNTLRDWLRRHGG